jgi:hypothetical protein
MCYQDEQVALWDIRWYPFFNEIQANNKIINNDLGEV